MASRPINSLVREAYNLAEAAGWPTSIKNQMLIIQPPGQLPPLQVDLMPNEATLDKWRATARTYNLMGDGPASTPEQREKAKEQAVEKANAAKEAAKVQAAAERAAAKEKAEAIARVEALQKAAIEEGRRAPEGLLFKEPVVETPQAAVAAPTVPVAKKAAAAVKTAVPAQAPAPTKNTDPEGYPVFSQALLTAQPSELRLTEGPHKGKYFCPVCWEEGKRFLSKLPQGLASHRGFRHGAYLDSSSIGDAAVAQAVVPQNVLTAVELLRSEMVEAFAGLVNSDEAERLQAQVEELTAKCERLQSDLTREQAEHRATTEKASDWKRTAEARDAQLSTAQQEKTGAQQAVEVRIKGITQGFETLLKQIQTLVQTQAPVQAVGKVDELVTKYLKD